MGQKLPDTTHLVVVVLVVVVGIDIAIVVVGVPRIARVVGIRSRRPIVVVVLKTTNGFINLRLL
jgi:GTP cyclohydrolase I